MPPKPWYRPQEELIDAGLLEEFETYLCETTNTTDDSKVTYLNRLISHLRQTFDMHPDQPILRTRQDIIDMPKDVDVTYANTVVW